MKIVIDTNVVMSGVFFGGEPLKVLQIVIAEKVQANATTDIIEEYYKTTKKAKLNQRGHFNQNMFNLFLASLEITPVLSTTDICRDSDDNKLLSCAKDAKAIFIVSGDNDLLTIGEFEGVHIVTVKQFLNAFYMSNGV